MAKVLGIVGSYRRGGVIDTLVSEVLASARTRGAQTEIIYLLDQHIEFCTNCRGCTQDAGAALGTCPHQDDMAVILARYSDCDAIVLGAPVNFFNLNALTRRFIERLLPFAYWPWGQPGPSLRVKDRGKKAVLITSTAMPALLARFFTGGLRALKVAAQTMGARPVAAILIGRIAQSPTPRLSEKELARARAAGRRLAAE